MVSSHLVRAFGACLAGLCLLTSASGAEFPTRPIKIVVGFGPGGLGDITTRAIAQKMSESLGKPVVVENMPGAGGITAAASVARAEPDGHTMLLVSGQNAASPSLFKSLPFNPATDFSMVSTVGLFDFVIVVGKDSPFKTMADFMAAAKREPDKINIGTISSGSVQNLSALMFTAMTGLTVPTVPFRTTGDVVTGLMSGQIQVGFETLPGVIGQLKAGTLRALAVAGEQPSSLLPDVPTAAASGAPSFVLVSWNGYVVPANTPRDVVLKLNREIAKALEAPDVRQRFIGFGITPSASTPEKMQAIYDADVVRWRKVITEAKIPQN